MHTVRHEKKRIRNFNFKQTMPGSHGGQAEPKNIFGEGGEGGGVFEFCNLLISGSLPQPVEALLSTWPNYLM